MQNNSMSITITKLQHTQVRLLSIRSKSLLWSDRSFYLDRSGPRCDNFKTSVVGHAVGDISVCGGKQVRSTCRRSICFFDDRVELNTNS